MSKESLKVFKASVDKQLAEIVASEKKRESPCRKCEELPYCLGIEPCHKLDDFQRGVINE